MLRTSNPALSDKAFGRARAAIGAPTMTIDGTVMKTLLLVGVTALSAGWVWSAYFGGRAEAAMGASMVGGIGAFIVALIAIFRPQTTPITAPLYAVLEGVFLGGISAMFEAQYSGLPMQAVGLTFGTLLALLFAYRTGLVRATENFRLGIVAATGGIMIFYLLSFVLGFFGVTMPLVHSNGLMGIGFSLFVVTIASLNLVLDFDFIERGSQAGAPKYMEWYGAFGTLVTLAWMYVEFLRLLSKLNSRD